MRLISSSLALLIVAMTSTAFLVADIIVVPHVIVGADDVFTYRTQFHIFNLTADQMINGKIEILQNGGYPLPCFATHMPVVPAVNLKTFSLGGRSELTIQNDSFGGFMAGWARIESSEQIEVIVTLQAQARGSYPYVATSTSLIPSPLGTQFTGYALVSSSASTGLAILNPSETETANLTLILRSKSGTLIGARTLDLGPEQKLAQFLWENNLFDQVPQIEGTLEITSNVPIALTVIRVDNLYWSAFPAFGGQ